MAATYDSADLLSSFNAFAGRPSSGDAITDATKYARLAKAQNQVVTDIASRHPECLYPTAAYGSYPTCTTTDNQIFTFGTDSNGYAVVPLGKTRIFPSLGSIPDSPWIPGRDYLDEGSQIRIPNNRSYAGTLYWRGITQPVDIDATHQPALKPEASRMLIVYRAVSDFLREGKRDVEGSAQYDGQYNNEFARWMLTWRTQFKGGGVLAPLGDVGGDPWTSGGYGWWMAP